MDKIATPEPCEPYLAAGPLTHLAWSAHMYITAANLLNAHWDGKLPVNVKGIAQSLGIRVFSDPMMEESGAIELIDGSPVISYNSTDATVRNRFTIAHEIGHFALGHLEGGSKKFRDPAANFSARSSQPEERAANSFAAQLLMPANVIKYAINEKNVKDVERLANIFGVSQVAMKYRLINIGVVHG